MLTRIDHAMVCVADLGGAMDVYARLGFSVHPGGVHTGKGTHNAIAFNDHDYLELLAVRDRDEYLRNSPYPGLLEFIAAGGGLRYLILQSDDLAAEVAAMRARGVDVSDPIDGARRTPAGGPSSRPARRSAGVREVHLRHERPPDDRLQRRMGTPVPRAR